jgi:acyl-coenzyme A thioesterase PaaI-like protein
MSQKLKQGFMRNVKLGSGSLRLLMNLWPPFIGAGIHVERIAPDYTEARVRMRLGLLNRNYMGTHFGGSLYAMTDPFFALLIMHQLGRRYVVWDKASAIDYKLPGRGTVRATFRITPEQIDTIRQATAGGDKYEPTFSVDVLNRQGEVVARVDKTIYVRLKPVSAKA